MIIQNRIQLKSLPTSWKEKTTIFEHRFHCRLTFHDFTGALTQLTAPDRLPMHHNWARCEAVRSRGGEFYANCLDCDTTQIEELCRIGQPFCKTCHAGLVELVYPILCQAKPVAVMFIGDFGDKTEPLDLLLFWGQLLAGEFRRGLEELPEGRVKRTEAEQIDLWFCHCFRNPGVSLDTLAKFLGVSRSRTSQLLRRHFQKSFPVLLNSYRVECARQILLNSRLSITEVAHLAGFRSANYLHRQFKALQGMTPEQYRDRAARS